MLNNIINQMLNSNPNMRNNPIVKNTMDMLDKGDSQGLKTLCENVCKSYGTSIEEMTKRINGGK